MTIILEKVSKSFDGGKSFALNEISLRVAQGEFIAVIGLSGAGKSTLLRTINGTLLPDHGKVLVLGTNVIDSSPRQLMKLRTQIGFIFQQFNLVKNISVYRNVILGRAGSMPVWRSVFGIFSKRDLAITNEVITSLGLEAKSREQVRNLSGGQQQRVAIARALVQEPRIILADEPMASLDPRLSSLVLDKLEAVNRQGNVTVIVNIHVLELAKKYARRIIAIRSGKIVFDGEPSFLDESIVENIYRTDSVEGDIVGSEY